VNTLDPKTRFLWLDVETTGFDPSEDLLLEVAWWPSRSSDPFDLDPCGARSVVLGHDGADLGKKLSPVTWDMHCKNGLLPEVVRSKVDRAELRNRLLTEVMGAVMHFSNLSDNLSDGWKPSETWHLAGNSVHFDRAFLDCNAGAFARRLSHRVLDVSAVALLARSVGMPIDRRVPAHRALDDVKSSILQLLACRRFFNDVYDIKYTFVAHDLEFEKMVRAAPANVG
jgi:oligoribonuclease